MPITMISQQAMPETSKPRGLLTTMQRISFRTIQRAATKRNGFSLIEMMIVVVVIAILAAIAIPIYQKQVQESRRTSAKTGLLDVASREEKYFSTNNAYVNNLATLGYAGTGANITVPNNTPTTDYYQIKVQLTGTTTPGSNFTATATAINTQASDACGNYTLTDLGVQGNSVTTNTGCW
jgi:type IV pilus assembly protein PilE